MQASPYDVSGYVDAAGVPLEPIAIETPASKQEYVRRQRAFAARGNLLRVRDCGGDRCRQSGARRLPTGSSRRTRRPYTYTRILPPSPAAPAPAPAVSALTCRTRTAQVTCFQRGHAFPTAENP